MTRTYVTRTYVTRKYVTTSCPAWRRQHALDGRADTPNPPGTVRHVAPIGRWLEVVRWTYPDGDHLDSIDLQVPDSRLTADQVALLVGDLRVAAGVLSASRS